MYFIIICIIAGLGAGIVTGLAGLSAAVVITPMLVSLGGMNSYDVVAIALASDVLASALSAFTYYRNKNIDIKRGFIILGPAFVCSVAGSYIGYHFSLASPDGIGFYSIVATMFLGIKFIVSPITKSKEGVANKQKKWVRLVLSVLSGIVIGLICGFVGVGGGAMMLFALTILLGYDLKTAVGTSTMIMTIIALTGATSHYMMGCQLDMKALCICVISTVFGAFWAAHFANRCEEKKLNRTVGIVLTILGAVTLAAKFIPGIQA